MLGNFEESVPIVQLTILFFLNDIPFLLIAHCRVICGTLCLANLRVNTPNSRLALSIYPFALNSVSIRDLPLFGEFRHGITSSLLLLYKLK